MLNRYPALSINISIHVPRHPYEIDTDDLTPEQVAEEITLTLQE
jgi:hypothetical protein